MTDSEGLLRLLARADVDLIIAGDLAATVHGSARLTLDVDVVDSRVRERAGALAFRARRRGLAEGLGHLRVREALDPAQEDDLAHRLGKAPQAALETVVALAVDVARLAVGGALERAGDRRGERDIARPFLGREVVRLCEVSRILAGMRRSTRAGCPQPVIPDLLTYPCRGRVDLADRWCGGERRN